MLLFRQFGVAVPKGTETLIHFRITARKLIVEWNGHVLLELDIDFQNAYPSLEWDSIREAVQEHLPELLPWTQWCHSAPVPVVLPSGEVRLLDRGAEQGDPLGNLYCALVLAGVSMRTRQKVQLALAATPATSQQPVGYLDAWYADDGQALMLPQRADLYLRTLDAEAALVGATRGSGNDIKSTVMLIGPPSEVANFSSSWLTPCVRQTCKVLEPNSDVEVLGGAVGSDALANMLFQGATRKVSDIHDSVALAGDGATELVLTRCCADACRVTHLMRTNGPQIHDAALQAYDGLMRRSLERILGGGVDDAAFNQAITSVKDSGLGFRLASALALPAFVASRTECRPWVLELSSAFASEGLLPSAGSQTYDAATEAATASMLAKLSSDGQSHAKQLIDAASEAANFEFATLTGLQQPLPTSEQRGLQAELLVQATGAEDPEHQLDDTGLQRSLMSVFDSEHLDRLSEQLLQAQRWEDARRLRELRDPSVSHDWLWCLNPAHGPHVPEQDYLACIRIRIGASFIDEPMLCPRCGNAVLGSSCAHALNCARGECNKGHYKVVDAVLQLVNVADSNADTEERELIPSAPTLRPADIFSEAAIPGCRAALDVGVTSPNATGAGADCCEAMFQTKLDFYRPHFAELSAQDIRYMPLVFSSYGRMHPQAQANLETVARTAARKRGFGDHRLLLRRATGRIGVAIWRRAAAMVRSCLPQLSAEEAALAYGEDPAGEFDIEDPPAAEGLVGSSGLSFLAA